MARSNTHHTTPMAVAAAAAVAPPQPLKRFKFPGRRGEMKITSSKTLVSIGKFGKVPRYFTLDCSPTKNLRKYYSGGKRKGKIPSGEGVPKDQQFGTKFSFEYKVSYGTYGQTYCYKSPENHRIAVKVFNVECNYNQEARFVRYINRIPKCGAGGEDAHIVCARSHSDARLLAGGCIIMEMWDSTGVWISDKLDTASRTYVNGVVYKDLKPITYSSLAIVANIMNNLAKTCKWLRDNSILYTDFKIRNILVMKATTAAIAANNNTIEVCLCDFGSLVFVGNNNVRLPLGMANADIATQLQLPRSTSTSTADTTNRKKRKCNGGEGVVAGGGGVELTPTSSSVKKLHCSSSRRTSQNTSNVVDVVIDNCTVAVATFPAPEHSGNGSKFNSTELDVVWGLALLCTTILLNCEPNIINAFRHYTGDSAKDDINLRRKREYFSFMETCLFVGNVSEFQPSDEARANHHRMLLAPIAFRILLVNMLHLDPALRITLDQCCLGWSTLEEAITKASTAAAATQPSFGVLPPTMAAVVEACSPFSPSTPTNYSPLSSSPHASPPCPPPTTTTTTNQHYYNYMHISKTIPPAYGSVCNGNETSSLLCDEVFGDSVAISV